MMKYISISRLIHAASERRERDAKAVQTQRNLAATMLERLGRPDSEARGVQGNSGMSVGR